MAIDVRGLTPLLEVFDMHESVAFYRDVIGFEVVHTAEPDGSLVWAMLRHGDVVLMLNERYEADERPAQRDPVRGAGHEDTELYFDCPDVDAAFRQLRASGCSVEEPRTTHYGMKQVWLADPDGFRLCFQCPS